jgi:hypothetical protein
LGPHAVWQARCILDLTYRRRGIEAQNRAAAAADTTTRSAFDELARGWFALAEQTDWLDKYYRDRQRDEERGP